MEKAYYDDQLNCVRVKISGYPELSEFKEVANSIIDLLIAHKADRVLNDTSDLDVNSIEIQEWVQNDWFPRAEAEGLKYFAFLVSKNIFGEVSAQQTNEKAEEDGNIKIKYFDSETEAGAWLQAQ